MKRRVAVTGIGVVAPCGVGKNALWTSVLRAHTRPPYVEPFRPADWFVRAGDRWLLQQERFVQIGVLASRLALNDAGFDAAPARPHRAGILSATALGSASTLGYLWEHIARGGRDEFQSPRFEEPLALASAPWFAAAATTAEFKLAGPCAALSGGRTVGLDALGLAFDHVQTGDADLMLACAAEAPRGDAANAGAVTLVLEAAASAARRRARAYAEMLSFGHGAPTSKTPALRVVRDVLLRAGVDARDVGYVDVHGERAEPADLFDLDAWSGLLGPEALRVATRPARRLIRQPLAPSGLLGVAAAIGVIKLSMAPPSADDDGSVVGDVAIVTTADIDGRRAAVVLRSVDADG
jgi:3-oxoacyl-(acyl-carrier-protein) synthase